MARTFQCFFMLSLCYIVLLGPTLVAQTTTGTILGTAKDQTGAVLPGVTITIRNLDTGAVREVITDDSGRYHLPQLMLGSYRVEATLAGFQTSVRTGIRLTVGREATVDF